VLNDSGRIYCLRALHHNFLHTTPLNSNHRFSVRGYQTFRLDREGHNGGVIILTRNNIPTIELPKATNNRLEIIGVELSIGKDNLSIYNAYCPPNTELGLDTMEIKPTNCIVVGDFNSHSNRWGFPDKDSRGDEVENWDIDNNLHLINKAEDEPSFYSRSWKTTSPPYLAFCTEDMHHKISRMVLNQLAGSDHKPIKLDYNINYLLIQNKLILRWNYKRADWDSYVTAVLIGTAGENRQKALT
jgi:hypothetical protein